MSLPPDIAAALADRYRLERELGSGGMATVYLAHDLRHNRPVALKLVRRTVAEAMGADRFLQEIQVTAGLQHPNIVPLFDSGRVGDLPWFVMPFIEGESLRERLRREGPLPVPDAIRILEQVAEALAAAHARGIIHRDIKPDNVMLSGRSALVADFGVARALSAGHHSGAQPTGGLPIGTPSYMAPEQVNADPRMDHRVDLYALGTLGYELLAGTPPFGEGTPQERMIGHLRGTPAPLAERRPDTPPALAALLHRCLAKDPNARPATAAEVAEALRALATGPQVPVRPGRRSWPAAAVAAAVLAVAGWWAFGRGGAGGDGASAGTLAIFPFTVRGSAEVQYLGEGMVNLLTTTLDGAGGMRTVDPRALIGLVRRQGDSVLTPEVAARFARDLGAGRFVLGDIVEAGGRLRIDATLYDGTRGVAALGRGDADGSPAATLDLVDSVASELLATGVAARGARNTSLSAVTSPSLPALRAYLEGERTFRLGRYREATTAYRTALDADPAFALAWFRMSIAAEWALLPQLAAEAAAEAVEHAARLGEHDTRLLEALLAFREGDIERSERLSEGILAVWPHDVDALIQLGEIRFHWGPLLGRPIAESRTAFERVLTIEPEEPTSLVHLARIAATAGDGPAARVLLERFLRLNPEGERALEVTGMVAAVTGNANERAAHRAALAAAPDVMIPLANTGKMFWTDAFEPIAEGIAEARRPDRSRPVRALGAVHAAYLAAMRGRWEEAGTALADAEALDPPLGTAHAAWLALLPFMPVSRDTLRALDSRLAALPSPLPPHGLGSAHFDIHDGIAGLVVPYLRGRLRARLGDAAGARAMAATIRAMPVDSVRLPTREALAGAVEMATAVATGNDSLALAAFDPLDAITDYESALFSPLFSFAAERFARAELLEAAGRADEAIRLYRSFEGFSFYDRVLAAPALLRAATQDEFAGRPEAARPGYERVVFLYADPDPALREHARQAQAGLARLGAGGRGG